MDSMAYINVRIQPMKKDQHQIWPAQLDAAALND